MKSKKNNNIGVKYEVANSSSGPFNTAVPVPFPELSSLERKQPHIPSSEGNNASSLSVPPTMTTTSAPISLPASHIHRTPSELQLEELTLLAEHEDVRMYSRLLCGMHDQIRYRCFVSGGYVHPLSRKSLEGVIKTNLANDQELKHREQDPNEDSADDGGWDECFIPIEEDNGYSSMGSCSSWSTLPQFSQGSKNSLMSLNRDTEEGEQEEDCVFSMEM